MKKNIRCLSFALFVAALCLAGAAARGEDAQGQSVEVAVSPQMKVKVQAPAGWTFLILPSAPGAAQRVVAMAHGRFAAASLDFLADEGGKLKTQQAVDDLVRLDAAALAKDSQEKQVNVVEMKSKQGVGAYAVLTMPAAGASGKVSYASMGTGRFVTGGVVVKFALHGGTLEQAVKMVAEGVAVETAK